MVKHLPSKHEALTSNSSTAKKKKKRERKKERKRKGLFLAHCLGGFSCTHCFGTTVRQHTMVGIWEYTEGQNHSSHGQGTKERKKHILSDLSLDPTSQRFNHLPMAPP
jgi:hypothetical protein